MGRVWCDTSLRSQERLPSLFRWKIREFRLRLKGEEELAGRVGVRWN